MIRPRRLDAIHNRKSSAAGRGPRRRPWRARAAGLWIEQLEGRCCPSAPAGLASAAIALPVDPSVTRAGDLGAAGAIDMYQITVDHAGLFTAHVNPQGFSTRLSLLDSQGQLLIESEASSPSNPDGQVALQLIAGDYFALVQDVSGSGSYTLATTFTAAMAPAQPLAGNSGAYSVAIADLTGTGVPDLVVADLYVNQVLVYLGTGEGSFQPPIALAVGNDPVFVTTADLTGNGIQDIITANLGSNDVSVLLGNGDGTFQPAIEVPAGPGASSVAVGDFNEDGHQDLAVTDSYSDDVQILLGRGDGTFAPGATVPASAAPFSVVAADLTGDGHTDLAVVSIGTSALTILEGNGAGGFTETQQLSTGPLCLSVIAADFTGGNLPDLAVACASNDTVQIYKNENGHFVAWSVIKTASDPFALAAADFNGDGRVDLAVTSYGVGGVSVYLGNGDGTFEPGTATAAGPSTTSVAAGDLNGDGRVDLVAADLINQTIDVLIGEGDGTFQPPAQPAATTSPPDVVAADLTNNGIEDLIIPDESTNEVSILLGRGDGTFRAPILIPVGRGPSSVAVADFNGDGIPDLAVTNRIYDSVSILLGIGNGTFVPAPALATGIQPSYVAAADLNGDGHVDLVVSNFYSSTLSIFFGNGNGTFQSQVVVPVGNQPGNPVIADFNGDGRPDIAVADDQSEVTILLATGPETYAAPYNIPAGVGASSLAAGDLTGDGKVDLVVTDSVLSGQSSIRILLGNGDGTFTALAPIPVADNPSSIALADLTGNGTLDIIATTAVGNGIMLLMGRGDGTFLAVASLPAGLGASAVAVAHLTGDGLADIAVADYGSGDVSVLLNLGGGVFGPPDEFSTGSSRIAMVTADFNDDGQLDVAIADPLNNTVTIFLGNGDGTFTAGQTLLVGIDPSGLVVGDFNGDGRDDIAVANAGSDDVMVFLGLGDGTFSQPLVLQVGGSPSAIVAGDLRHNGITDLAVANELSNTVTVLFGRGDGTFLPGQSYAVGAEPVSLVAADLSGDGLTDLVTANRTSGDLTILWGLSSGGFAAQTITYGGHAPSALAVGDFNGDGCVDLAVADDQDDQVSILFGLPGGGFTAPVAYSVGQAPDFLQALSEPDTGTGMVLSTASTGSQNDVVLIIGPDGSLVDRITIPLGAEPDGEVIGDFNNDGVFDIAFPGASDNQVVVRLGSDTEQAIPPEDSVPLPGAAPIVVDWNGDGIADVFDLDQEGQLLLRIGEPGSPGDYYAPRIIGSELGVAFRDIALVKTNTGWAVAALQQDQPVVWLFSPGIGPGNLIAVQPIAVPNAGFLVSITSGDLDGDGLDDLVLVDRAKDQVILLYQSVDGTFEEDGPRLDVGSAPSDVQIALLGDSPWPDLIVTNTYSGDISVFDGGPGRTFGPEVRLAAGLGAAEVVSQDGALVRHTADLPIGLTAGVFGQSGLAEVVAADSGADRITLLQGTADGLLADPSLATSESTGLDPTQIVATALTSDGLTDLVVLNRGSQDISIFLNNGKGGFITMPRVDAGNNPTGVAVRDVNGDGIPDLLVSNEQGDLLIILGNGDGTFKPYERADQTVSLAVGDFNSDGQPEFVLSNTSLDQLTIEYGETQSFVQGRSQGLQAPGAVAVADLNGDGNADIIVINKGANDIIVYLGLGGNRFEAPLRFYTGTDPVGLTVADLNGDGVPDLIVANAGSNDLSIFLGVGKGADWTLETGPRLRVGLEPVSTTVADLGNNGIPDIIAVDQGSDNVVVLRGVGQGFFNDIDPLTLAAGQSPIRAFVGKFDAAPGPGLAVLDSASNNLTYYSNFLSATAVAQFIPTGGLHPIAAVMGVGLGNGYNDLVIAHSGNNIITLFEGTPDGLVLTDTVALGQTGRLSDVVISSTAEGQLHLDLSAQGRDLVISVTINLGVAAASTPAPSGGASNPETSSSSGTATSGLLTGAGPLFTEHFLTEAGTQGQITTMAAVVSGITAGATGQWAVATGMMFATIEQIMAVSSGSLPGLINSLVQVGQVQISDILPVEKSGVDSIAVLLFISSSTGDNARGNGPASAEADIALESAASGNDELADLRPARATHLERFLLEQGLSSSDGPRALAASAPRRIKAVQTVVIMTGDVGNLPALVDSHDRQTRSPAGPEAGGPDGSDAGVDSDTEDTLSALSAFDREAAGLDWVADGTSESAGWVLPCAGVVVLSCGLMGWRAIRAYSSPGRPRPAGLAGPSLAGLRSPHGSYAGHSRGFRATRVDDLPPRLSGRGKPSTSP